MGKVREILEKYMWEYAKQEPTYCEVDINKYVNQALTQLKSFIPSEEEIEEILKDLGLDEMGTIPFPYNEISQAIHKRLEDIFK